MKVTMPPSFVERQSRLMREGQLSAKRILDRSGGKEIIEEYAGFKRVKTVDGHGTTRQILTLDEDFSHLSIMDKAGILLKRVLINLTDKGLKEEISVFSPSKGTKTKITKVNGQTTMVEGF